jgi:hypothetical protein
MGNSYRLIENRVNFLEKPKHGSIIEQVQQQATKLISAIRLRK